MTRPKLALTVPLLALTVAIAACGGSSGSSASEGAAQATAAGDAQGGPGDTAALPACTALLSDAEAEAILSTKPKPVTDQSFPGNAYCSWDIGDGFSLTVKASTDPTSVDLWRGEKDSVPTAVDGKETAPPSGLGDESYAFDANADTYWVFVRRGDTTLRVSGPASALPEQVVRDLVEKLYSRF